MTKPPFSLAIGSKRKFLDVNRGWRAKPLWRFNGRICYRKRFIRCSRNNANSRRGFCGLGKIRARQCHQWLSPLRPLFSAVSHVEFWCRSLQKELLAQLSLAANNVEKESLFTMCCFRIFFMSRTHRFTWSRQGNLGDRLIVALIRWICKGALGEKRRD